VIVKFSCSCGNTDPAKTIEYDGALGYEAIICTVCCALHDHEGQHPADDFSRSLVLRREPRTVEQQKPVYTQLKLESDLLPATRWVLKGREMRSGKWEVITSGPLEIMVEKVKEYA
jgi:hypothetical protein